MPTSPLTDFQFSLSTAEDERNYFSALTPPPLPEPAPEDVLAPGTYRVIDGRLFRITTGVPPLK